MAENPSDDLTTVNMKHYVLMTSSSTAAVAAEESVSWRIYRVGIYSLNVTQLKKKLRSFDIILN